ncbi:MAG TPA: type II secretion system protein [Tepidisphaeraceae bacterium]|nr:type II secretion system protein [Tepidisphaeraceae bacterium]
MNVTTRLTRPRFGRGRRPAFTLVELLVVIGIIGVLLAILLPTIFSATRQASRKRTLADLHAVTMALEEYNKDFKGYPRPPLGTTAGQNRKARILGTALIGPGGKNADGADGPGFRTEKNSTGKVWGPYLPIEKFKTNPSEGTLLDRYDMEIYYFPQWRGFTKGPPPTPLFGNASSSPILDPLNAGKPAQPKSVYDWAAADVPVNTGDDPSAVLYLRKALGDDDLDDLISSTETLKDTPQFILLSVGQRKKFTAADGAAGREKIKKNFDKCDEVSTVPGAP